MRGTVAKRLRKEAANQVTVRATMERRRHSKAEFDQLVKYKKRNHRKPLGQPKLKLTRRQDRDLKMDNAMPAKRYQDRLFTRHSIFSRMKRRHRNQLK